MFVNHNSLYLLSAQYKLGILIILHCVLGIGYLIRIALLMQFSIIVIKQPHLRRDAFNLTQIPLIKRIMRKLSPKQLFIKLLYIQRYSLHIVQLITMKSPNCHSITFRFRSKFLNNLPIRYLSCAFQLSFFPRSYIIVTSRSSI